MKSIKLFLLLFVLLISKTSYADVTINCSTQGTEIVSSTVSLSSYVAIYSIHAAIYSTSDGFIAYLPVSEVGSKSYYAQYYVNTDGRYLIVWQWSGMNYLGQTGDFSWQSSYYNITFTPKTGWVENQVYSDQWNNVRSNSNLLLSGYQLFYINTNNQVCSLFSGDGVSYGDQILNSSASAVLSGCALANNGDDVYYAGSNSKIHRLRWNSSWNSVQVYSGQWNNVRSSSNLIVNGYQIFYINTNNQVCSLFSGDGISYGDQVLSSSAPSVLNGCGLGNNGDDIYYTGTDSKIYRLRWSGSWAASRVCSDQWNNVKSNSILKVNGHEIYYINTNSQVCSLFSGDGVTYGDQILNSSAPAILNGTGITNKSDDIYYVGSDSKIYKLYWNGSWQYQSIHQSLTCQHLANVGIVGNSSSSTDEIFYTGKNDSKIHKFYQSFLKSSEKENMENLVPKNIPEKSFRYYPNPVTNSLTVEIPTSIEGLKIEIMNVTGTKIKTVRPLSNLVSIDCSDLNSGVHLIKVTGENYNKISKFHVVK